MQNGSSRGPREDTLPNAVIQEDDVRWTPLHEAAAIGDDKRLQTLLAANADRTAKESKHGNTPLHEAAWRGFSRCVKVLCAPPNPKKDQKDKKLKGVLQETRGALHSALLGIRNDGGFSALHLAAQNGHNQSCREILLAGGDPDIQNNYGDTALHTACRYGHAGATRILLSATCDSNKANLNGDSPLHIACAMGRRKLTRILLEAGSNMAVRNSQEETPRDIAIRKNYGEILNILDNPRKLRRDKDKSSGSGGGGRNSGNRKRQSKGDFVDGVANPVSWSPYGCHYFPDPSSFPSPKLDTLPKEPLKKGEQYYLDLAGNICKGPVGVGNTCYCGPFFRHIEDKINRNRKSLRKYVFKATERLDSKVQALAIRTDDQIEQLTRSMIADRIRCESRRLHLEHWLKRGEPYRLTTTGHQSRPRKKPQTLSRCKSLELLDEESLHGSKIQNSKSFDALEEAVVTVHREDPNDDDNLSVASLDRVSRDGKRWDRLETDYFNVSERLEELLAKTNEILEMEKEASKRRKEELLAFTEPTFKRRDRRNQNAVSIGKDIIEQMHQVTLEAKPAPPEDLNQITVLPLEEVSIDHGQEASGGLNEATNDYVTYLSRMQSSRTSEQSHNRPLQEKYQSFSQMHNNEHMLQDVISAIRKDHQMVKELIESETLNEMENTHEDKLSYKDEQTLLNVNGFFQNTCFDDSIGDSPSNTLKAENKVTMTSVKNISELCEKPFEVPTYAELNKLKPCAEPSSSQSKDWRRKPIKNSNKDLEDLSERVSGTIKKVEIKNSEIKTLKKPSGGGILKRSKVQELVARLQGKLSSSTTVKSIEHDESSESSEDENADQHEAQQLENNQMHSGTYTSYRQPQMNSPNNSGVVPANNTVQMNHSTSMYSTPVPNNSYPYRLIPKDAYFHELPNKSRPSLQSYRYSNQSDAQIQQQPLSLPNNYYHHQHQQSHHQNLQNQQQQHHHQQIQQQTWVQMPTERRMPVSLQQQQQHQHQHQQQQQQQHHHHAATLLNPSYTSAYNNMPPLMVHTPPQPLRTPVTERLLTNRKFMPTSSSSPDYELAATPVNLKNCNQMQNANLLLQQTSTAGLMSTIDHQQHIVERDVSNDSGFSTRIYGGGSESHRPSPSLSGHTDYGGMQSPSHGLMYPSGQVQTDTGDVTYYMGNVSSLV